MTKIGTIVKVGKEIVGVVTDIDNDEMVTINVYEGWE